MRQKQEWTTIGLTKAMLARINRVIVFTGHPSASET